MALSGIFITIEGPDGAGKSTQAKMLAAYLQKQGRRVILTREPGGTHLAEKIRDLVLTATAEPMAPTAEVLLYAASRAQHVAALIAPALAKGAVVISDRFVDSSIAYQGYGRELGADLVWQINQPALGGLLPHLTIVLDIEPAAGQERLARRNEREKTAPDRLEQEELAFHHRVRAGFLDLVERYPGRMALLNAIQGPAETHTQIISLLRDRLDAELGPLRAENHADV